MIPPASGSALLFDASHQRWLHFTRPRRILVARDLTEVLPALHAVEAATAAGGYAAGFVSYEAAPAFDPALTATPADDFPLLWFGLYAAPETVELPPPPADPRRPEWTPGLMAEDFAAAIAAIHAQIARGATYQVNFTFPLLAALPDDPFAFFVSLVHGQGAAHAGYLDCGRYVVCSASPELFFRRDGNSDVILCRPMKGTTPRAPTGAEDRRRAHRLRHSVKERAENVMILDMLRNDLGRLGPVTVPALFALEKYPTLWQLTSTATARSRAGLAAIFSALFPCASITGAPKVATSALIHQLEGQPRRLYTGAFGWAGPNGEASFGVAIRTALCDREARTATYGVGAGITADSQATDEYAECLAKGRILTQGVPPFDLLASLRWDPQVGYTLLVRHLQRLAASARYFDRPCDTTAVRRALQEAAAMLPLQPHKVRLVLAADGVPTCTASPLHDVDVTAPLRLRLAPDPVDENDPFLYHKTTRRQTYDRARAATANVDETVLWNGRGEVTEACNYNLVIERGGRRVTPPISSGLLGGTLREELLRTGEIHEGIVRVEELPQADALWLINSVRGWRRAVLDEATPGTSGPPLPAPAI
ncbi:MAG TPA: aminodeoxychorismate synthase, component I [Desulfuromonas sp.]|nr:aminodeoxychorismate synthase, component I [Desulfuromonas sp.]